MPLKITIKEQKLPKEILSELYENEDAIFILIEKKKKKGDRCIRIAKRKYHRWPSAYASGALVKCRQGKIWKGLKENTDSIIEYEILEMSEADAILFLEAFQKEKEQGLHGWFSRNRGKGWIDCRTGKPCGRSKAGRGTDRKYPACRPTKAQCNKSGTRRKRGPDEISWKPKK